MTPRRTFWFLPTLSKDSKTALARTPQASTPDRGNLISSRLTDGRHAPTLDIDLPCDLVESSTPGHFHLYIDKPMPWEDYLVLLHTLAAVGIIERGYYDASVKQGASFLRPPGQMKEAA